MIRLSLLGAGVQVFKSGLAASVTSLKNSTQQRLIRWPFRANCGGCATRNSELAPSVLEAQKVADLLTADLVRTTHGQAVDSNAQSGDDDKRSGRRGSGFQRPSSRRGDGPGQRPGRP